MTFSDDCQLGGMHRWDDGRCSRCGGAWVDYLAEARASGFRIAEEPGSITLTPARTPRVFGWMVFGESVLDDPEGLAAMLDSTRIAVARQAGVELERVAWEEPLVGRTWPRTADGEDGDALGRIYVFGDLAQREVPAWT